MKNIKAILFVEGLISVSLQFLFMRHLLPYVGSSVVVTSIIVSIFLLALALGYHYGGNVREAHLQQLSKNLFMSAVILIMGLSPFSTLVVFAEASAFLPNLVLMTLYVSIFMAPAAFWMGQTMPLLSNQIRAESNGKVSGTVLFFSTVGNVAGGLFSVLILMKYLGLAWTIYINLLLLLGLYLYINEPSRQRVLKTGATAVVACLLVVGTDAMLHDMTTHYASYKVKAMDFEYTDPAANSRVLFSNNLGQSIIDDKGNSAVYIEHMRLKIAHRVIDKPLDVLVLGAGGFTLGHLDKVNRYTYVDIDDRIKDYAEQKFLKGPINGNFVASDARLFLIEQAKKYDVIVLDVYNAGFAVPSHLATREFYQLVQSRLKQPGFVLINAVMTENFSDTYSSRLHETIASVFSRCVINEFFDTDQNIEQGNFVYSCPVGDKPAAPFIDNKVAY